MNVRSRRFFLIRAQSSVPASRRRIRDLIDEWALRLDEDSDIALATVVSELVTNAVLHGDGAVLTIGVHANLALLRIVIEVHDGSPVMPQVLSAGPAAETGRGMLLISSLAVSHGVARTERGKRVWAELTMPEQPLPRRQLVFRPRQVGRAAARRLSGSRKPRIHQPARAASRPC